MSSATPAAFDELDGLHRQIGVAAVQRLADEGIDWAECRLLVQFKGHSDPDKEHVTRFAFFYLDERVKGLTWPEKDLIETFRVRFGELTGEQLARFRLEIQSDGGFEVKYFYDNVDGTATWVWPDEEGYLTPKELRENNFQPR